jgi:hypothetical protein
VVWRDLEAAAPEIARLGRERLEGARVALLGTVRADGSPRISPVEPYLWQGHLLFGVMPWSAKRRDLARDPRCVLHSAVTGPDSGEGELKLDGRAVEAGDDLRTGCRAGWWTGRPAGDAAVFSLQVERAAFVSWDLAAGRMTVLRWSARGGYRTAGRAYP